ncbi:NAD(P)H-dependent oxidoreductase [Nitriliruptoraceae bacterium ZYF776]|nr:NAD(P)H-dependent oxidoreductase [Profundirhabdus halotolerans]
MSALATSSSPRPTATGDPLVPAPRTLRLLVVSAAAPEGRSGRLLTAFVLDRLRTRDDLEVTALPVAEALADRTAWAEAVTAADAVVVVTPEHNHSFPGDLKSAIDLLRHEWTATPVGVVSYGGVSGGLRATEQLRLVFAELHTLVVRDTVGVAHVTSAFDDAGRPHDHDGLVVALDRLVAGMDWWARTLATGLERAPYPS